LQNSLHAVVVVSGRDGVAGQAAEQPASATSRSPSTATASAGRRTQRRPARRQRPVSPGDRACLALAQRLTAPAVTAEHIWADIDLDITILGIRPPQTYPRLDPRAPSILRMAQDHRL